MKTRWILILTTIAVLWPATVAARPVAPQEPGPIDPAHHTSEGGVTVNPTPGHGVVEEGHSTNEPAVTIGLPAPDDATAQIRVSNDGSSWLTKPYATVVPWDLTDPAAGGTEGDGFKTVYVQIRVGSTWVPLGSDYLYLDRTPPEFPDFQLEGGADSVASWRPRPTDGGGGLTSRMSLDGVRWTDWGQSVDIRSIDYGGSWDLGPRTIYYQFRDIATNVSEVVSDTIDIEYPPLGFDEGTLPVRFEFPKPAITGSPFTIRPVYPSDFTMPSNAWCGWRLHWGDEESLYGHPNEHFGEVSFERKASSGGCGPWTLTLPYNTGRKFNIQFELVTRKLNSNGVLVTDQVLFANQTWKILEFTAQVGTTDRHIRESTIPLVYLLPSSTLTQLGDPVTYRLYASGGLPVPQTGTFWAYTNVAGCNHNPMWHQDGGTSYTYTPDCAGDWITGWTGTYKGGEMRTEYDPVVDGKPPVVGLPVVRLDARGVGTRAPVVVTYSAKDVDSGLYQFQLQQSVNGGAWSTVTLSNRLLQRVPTSVSLTATTRYRVRGRDVVGNWSAWKYGPTVRAQAYQESYQWIAWSTGWTKESSTAWMAGAARVTGKAAATAGFNFTARSIAWVGRKGPSRGFVRVWLDGKVVATVDLRHPTTGTRQILWATTFSDSVRHALKIENLGTTGTPTAVIDAFIVVR